MRLFNDSFQNNVIARKCTLVPTTVTCDGSWLVYNNVHCSNNQFPEATCMYNFVSGNSMCVYIPKQNRFDNIQTIENSS